MKLFLLLVLVVSCRKHRLRHGKQKVQHGKQREKSRQRSRGVEHDSFLVEEPGREKTYVVHLPHQEVIPQDQVKDSRAIPFEVEWELSQGLDTEDDQYVTFRKRDPGFTCEGDQLSGPIYMVGGVQRGEVTFQQVRLTVSLEKLMLQDRQDRLMHLGNMKMLLPTRQDLQEHIVEGHAVGMEHNRIHLFSAASVMDTPDGAYQREGLYCLVLFSLVENNPKQNTLVRDLAGGHNLLRVLQALQESHPREAYHLLTLCYPSQEYVQRWMVFLNREKIDCHVDFNPPL